MSSTTAPASLPFHPGTPWGLFRFETPELGGGADPGVADPGVADPGLSDPSAGADPGADPSAAAPEPAASAPTWGPDSPEFLAAVDQALAGRLADYQQPEYQPEYGQQPGYPDIDFFADDAGPTLLGHIGQMLEQALEQRLGPIERSHHETIVDQGRQESMQTFESFTDLGDFDRDQAFARAQDIYTGYAAQFGPHAAERFTGHALRQAAEQQRQFEQAIEARAIERYKAELAGATQRPNGEPPVAGGGVRPSETESSYDAVMQRYEARARAGAAQL